MSTNSQLNIAVIARETNIYINKAEFIIMVENKIYIISKCIELIRTFNPVTHSIDTFIAEKLGNASKPVSHIFIHIMDSHVTISAFIMFVEQAE